MTTRCAPRWRLLAHRSKHIARASLQQNRGSAFYRRGMADYDQNKGPEPTSGVWEDDADLEKLTPEELLARGDAIIESGDVDRLIEWGWATMQSAKARGRPDIARRAQDIVRNLAEKQAVHVATHARLKELLDG